MARKHQNYLRGAARIFEISPQRRRMALRPDGGISTQQALAGDLARIGDDFRRVMYQQIALFYPASGATLDQFGRLPNGRPITDEEIAHLLDLAARSTSDQSK